MRCSPGFIHICFRAKTCVFVVPSTKPVFFAVSSVKKFSHIAATRILPDTFALLNSCFYARNFVRSISKILVVVFVRFGTLH